MMVIVSPDLQAQLLVREASVQDIAAVHAITQAAYAGQRDIIGSHAHVYAETPPQLAERLAEGWIILLAELEGHPVGAVRFTEREGELYVGRLAVMPSVQRRGIGRTLMAAAEAWGRAFGLPAVRLGAYEDVVQSRPYYESLGYEAVDRIELRNTPGRYFWRMHKPLRSAQPDASLAAITVATYERHAPRFAEDGCYAWAHRALEAFSEVTPPPACIGAVGCGPGPELCRLQACGYRPIGIDRTSTMLQFARRVGVPLVQADLRSLPLAGEAFDAVWSSAALLHVARIEIAVALHELRRVVKPGGALLLTLKQGHGEAWREVKAGRRFFAFYQPDEVRRLLGGAGFEIVRQWVDDPASTPAASGNDPWIATVGRAVERET